MRKAMISQPMAGKTDLEIIEDRNRAMAYLEERGFEIVNTLFTDEWYSKESMTERGVVQRSRRSDLRGCLSHAGGDYVQKERGTLGAGIVFNLWSRLADLG